MYDPKNVFTSDGLKQHMVHLFNMEQAIFWLLNNADDLHIETSSDTLTVMDVLHAMESLLESKFLLTGDGETEEDTEDNEPIPMLLSCPKCGELGDEAEPYSLHDSMFWFHCGGCGYDSDSKKSLALAMAAWNNDR